MKQRKWMIMALFIAVFVMGVLFYSSSQTYSQQSLVPTMDKILKGEPFKVQLSQIAFHYGGSEVSIQAMGYSKFLEFFLRKFAHFFSYFVMGVGLYIGLSMWLKKTRLQVFLALLIPLLYAAFDEFHQSLTGGRTPLVQDVILDFCGAFVGVMVSYLICRRKKWFLN